MNIAMKYRFEEAMMYIPERMPLSALLCSISMKSKLGMKQSGKRYNVKA